MGMLTYVGRAGRYHHAVRVATPEQASAGNTVESVIEPQRISAVNSAPPRGTLKPGANPAPAPQEPSRRRCAGVSLIQPASTLAEAPPSSLGAASRALEAPMPITISDMTPVPRERRNESSPVPFHSASSTSEFSPLV